MKEVRDLKVGDVVRLDYGIDNRVTCEIEYVEVHNLWTKIKGKALLFGSKKYISTWVYTDACVEIVNSLDECLET